MIEQVLCTAIADALSRLAPRAHGLYSHALPTETHLPECVLAIQRALEGSVFAASRVVIGSSAAIPERVPEGFTILPADAAAAKATRLRNDPAALPPDGLLLYFNTDSTPGEAGLEYFTELTSPEIVRAFALHAELPLLRTLASSRSRRVLTRLEDASVPLLAEYARLAHQHSEAYALPLLSFLPRATGHQEALGGLGANEFDGLHGIRASGRLREAHAELRALPEEQRLRVTPALAARLLASGAQGGADAVERAEQLCAAAARFASGEDDEPRKLHGLTVELVRLLKRGAEGIRALQEREPEDAGLPDSVGTSDDEVEQHLTEEELLHEQGASAFLNPLEMESDWRLTLRDPATGATVQLQTRASLSLVNKTLEIKGVETFWTRRAGLRISDAEALLATSIAHSTTAEPVLGDVHTALESCTASVREAAEHFLGAREALLIAVGKLATSATGLSPDAPEEEEHAEPTEEGGARSHLLTGVAMLELYPLTSVARCDTESRAYISAYEALLKAVSTTSPAVPQGISEWLTNLDVAFTVESKRVKTARLLPTHPLRVTHAQLWLRTGTRPPTLPPTLAVHYRQTDLLWPQGREHVFTATSGVTPNELGLALAAREGLRAAWSILRPPGLVSALEIEVIDVVHAAPVVDSLCKTAVELFSEDAEAGSGLHLEVRFAYSSAPYKDEVRVPRPDALASLTVECLNNPRGSGVSLSLQRNLLSANARPCHLSVQVVETPFISFPDEANAADIPEATLVYKPGPGGNIALVELTGHTPLTLYQALLKELYIQSPRRGLNPSIQPPEVGAALIKALVASRGWPVPPKSEASLTSMVSYEEAHDHVVVVLADREVLSSILTSGLLRVSRTVEGADLDLQRLRNGILAMYSCRSFLQNVIAESDPRHLLGMLGLLRAFDAAQSEAEDRPVLALSLDSPEGRRWARAHASHDGGTATRADLLLIEATPDRSSIKRLRVAELKARATNAELSSERALARLALQPLTAVTRLHSCFARDTTPAHREQVEALRSLLWLGAGHQQKALEWVKVLEALDSALNEGTAPEVIAECWIVPEQRWSGEHSFTLRLPNSARTGAVGQAEFEVHFRVLEKQSAQGAEPLSASRSRPGGTISESSPTGRRSTQQLAVVPTPQVPSAPVPPSEPSHPEKSTQPARSAEEAGHDSEQHLTRDVAPGTAPQSSDVHADGIRVVFGETMKGEPALWLPNRTDLVNHFNVGITGTMGTGKTQLTKSVLAQLIWQGRHNPEGRSPGLLAFDYKGDYVDSQREAFATAIGATVHPPEELPLNPLHPSRPKTKQEFALMARQFADTLMAIAPNMGTVQRNEVIRAVRECYANAGIDEKAPRTWERPFPTINDLSDFLQTNDLAEGIPQAIIQDLADLNVFAPSDPQLDMDVFFDGINVIDLKPLGGTPTIIRAILSFFMNTFYERMLQKGEAALELRGEGNQRQHLRQLRRLVLVDEADDFIGLNLTSLKNVMQQGRSFGCGVILSTQFLHHFNRSETPLRPLIGTWVLHQMTDLNSADLKALFGLTSRDEVSTLAAQFASLPKHTSLCSGVSRPASRERLMKVRDCPFMNLPRPKGSDH